jgi:hypothetical protein
MDGKQIVTAGNGTPEIQPSYGNALAVCLIFVCAPLPVNKKRRAPFIYLADFDAIQHSA